MTFVLVFLVVTARYDGSNKANKSMCASEGPHSEVQCPQCHSEVHVDPDSGERPSFCLHCRFPLMVVAGKYRLQRVVGEGGMATLYEAHPLPGVAEGRRVVKVLKPELLTEDSLQARFLREVRLTSGLSLKSEHIVRIFDDFGDIPKLGTFYVMEYLEGKPLSELIEQDGGRLPVARCFHFFRQLCKAMQVAHLSAIVHRDLKPDNLFVIEHNNEPDFLKVIDFGIARSVGSEQLTNLTQGALGTPAYMAPELYMNQGIGPATDVYAMGILLFELLVGYTPFAPPHLPAPTAASFMASHLMQPPPGLLESLPEGRDVPAALEDVFQKAVAKKPEERFSSAAELYKAFLEVVQPLLALPVLSSISSQSAPGALLRALQESFGELPAATAESLDGEPNDAELEAILRVDLDGLVDDVSDVSADELHAILGDELPSVLPQKEEPEETFDGPAPPAGHPDAATHAALPAMFDVDDAFARSDDMGEATFETLSPLAYLPAGQVGPGVSIAPDYEVHTQEELPAVGSGVPVNGGHALSLEDELLGQEESTVVVNDEYFAPPPIDPKALIETHVPARPARPKRGVWLGVGLVGLVTCFALVFLALQDDGPFPTKPPVRARQTLKTPLVTIGTAPLPRSPAVRPQPIVVDAGVKQAKPDETRTPPTKPRTRPVVRRVRRKVRKRQRGGRLVRGCPRLRGWFWVKLQFATRAQLKTRVRFSTGGKVVRRRHFLCVGVKHKYTKVTLGDDKQFSLCTLTISQLPTYARIQLSRKSFIEPSAPDYCIHR